MTGRKLLGVIGSLALTAVLIVGVVWAARSSGSGGEGAAVAPLTTPTPTSEATPAPATLAPTPTASPPASPVPLPEPQQGHVWYTTPDTWVLPFAVQIPEDWVRTTDATFVPEGTAPNLPYPTLPQLQFVVAAPSPNPPDAHPGWQHPFIWQLGRQGGGGCSGDVSGTVASPSGRLTAGGHTWDLYRFTCAHENLNYPPGVTYDGRVAEALTNDLAVAVIALDPPGSEAARQAFQTALESLRLQ